MKKIRPKWDVSLSSPSISNHSTSFNHLRNEAHKKNDDQLEPKLWPQRKKNPQKLRNNKKNEISAIVANFLIFPYFLQSTQDWLFCANKRIVFFHEFCWVSTFSSLKISRSPPPPRFNITELHFLFRCAQIGLPRSYHHWAVAATVTWIMLLHRFWS